MNKKGMAVSVIIIIIIIGGIYLFTQGSLTAPAADQSSNKPFPISGDSPTPPPLPIPEVNINPSPTPTTPSGTPTNPAPTPSPTPASTSTTHNISIQNFAFSPSNLTIKKGEKVNWINMDSTSHTVTGTAGGPNSGTIKPTGFYSFTFNTVGTFTYRCNLHPSMTASITVTN